MGYQSFLRPGAFADRTAIVTGGGSGIGRCVAHELASLGAHVVVVGRDPKKLDGVANEIAEDGGSAGTAVCDIRSEENVRDTVATIVAERGRIHALVNNAGGQYPSPLASITQKGFETVVRTNLVGGFVFAREVYTQSLRQHGGAIVNVTADFWRGMPMMGHSGAARAGMDNFTRSACVEWAPEGVRVNAVAPGWVASSGLDTYEDPAIRAVIPRLREGVPLKRLATEAEVSAAICFLLCDAAAFITGVNLAIDGGASLASPVFPLPPARNVSEYQGFHRYIRPKALGDE
jgi:citronellol/citronellal dehydrogenase